MNTTKGSTHGTNKETARNLLDVRIILAVLWVAGMLSQFKWGYLPLECDDRIFRSKLRNIVSNGHTICGPHFYECLDPDVEVSRESLGKPHNRHILCHNYYCFLGFRFYIATRWL